MIYHILILANMIALSLLVGGLFFVNMAVAPTFTTLSAARYAEFHHVLDRHSRIGAPGCVLLLKTKDEEMPLLLTQDDLRPLLESPSFFTDVFQVIRDSLLQRESSDQGYLSWLAFPLGEEERRFNINALAT